MKISSLGSVVFSGCSFQFGHKKTTSLLILSYPKFYFTHQDKIHKTLVCSVFYHMPASGCRSSKNQLFGQFAL